MTTRYVPTNKRSNKGEGLYSELTYVVNCPPTAPIELMVRAMALQGGGILQLGPFVYTIRGTLNIVTTVTIQGIPGATKIVKTDGEGPAVRVFGGARLKDCIIERNQPAVAYTADQEPTRPWENSVVHLCELVFESVHVMTTTGGSATQDGWQGTIYGAATIEGCGINTRVSKTRGIYVGLYGVEAEARGSETVLDNGYLNARVVNNTIIPVGASPIHSCIYFGPGGGPGIGSEYTAVCLGNICRSGVQAGTTGVISYSEIARQPALARGSTSAEDSAIGSYAYREEANIATYSEY